MSARVAWETPECCASSTQKNARCAFAQVLAKTDPLSAGLRTNARSEGHGQLFSASGFAVTDASAENIDAQGGAAFQLTMLMVEWPESGSNFGGGSKNQPPKTKALVTLMRLLQLL